MTLFEIPLMNPPGVETQLPGIEAAKTIKVFISSLLYATDITGGLKAKIKHQDT
jgi:hypothetical protein